VVQIRGSISRLPMLLTCSIDPWRPASSAISFNSGGFSAEKIYGGAKVTIDRGKVTAVTGVAA